MTKFERDCNPKSSNTNICLCTLFLSLSFQEFSVFTHIYGNKLATLEVHWCRVVVKPVVDDRVLGGAREEKWVEKVAIVASFGCLWGWRLRDDVESLVVVAKAKRELAMSFEVADLVGGCITSLRTEAKLSNVCREDHDRQDKKV
ncbi:hypothetical protein ACFX2A_032097 [Malus domestica]